MIWMTWRQHRREALILAVAVAAMAIYLIIMGRAMYSDYYRVTNGLSVALCQHLPPEQQNGPCGNITGAFNGKYVVSTQIPLLAFMTLPPLLGVFVGAPLLARELEGGTFRLIWTQSVTRLRWLLTKVGVLMSFVLLTFAAFIPLIFWWKEPFNYGGESTMIGGQDYPIMGTLPLAYATFAVALGLAAGALLRRVVPAMFVTLAIYVGVALALGNWGRPNWLPPVSTTWNPYLSQGPTDMSRDAWILFFGYVDKTGQRVSFDDVYQTCAPDGRVINSPGVAYTACIHNHGWLSTIVWQPADRFWAFQGIESAVLVALAALLTLTIWLVRRRIS
jgi:ABC-2 family transporter